MVPQKTLLLDMKIKMRKTDTAEFFYLLEAPVDSNIHTDVKTLFYGRSTCAALFFC